MREVQDKDREEKIKISGFLSLSPHHTRNLQFFSVNKQNISSCELHKEVQEGQNVSRLEILTKILPDPNLCST